MREERGNGERKKGGEEREERGRKEGGEGGEGRISPMSPIDRTQPTHMQHIRFCLFLYKTCHMAERKKMNGKETERGQRCISQEGTNVCGQKLISCKGLAGRQLYENENLEQNVLLYMLQLHVCL